MTKPNPLKGQRRFISIVVILVLSLSLVAIFTGQDLGPFSSYSLYASKEFSGELNLYTIYGVTEDLKEIRLTDKKYLGVFHGYPLQQKLIQKFQKSGTTEKGLRILLEEVYRTYHKRLLESQHEGPKLIGLKVYLAEWDLQPSLKSLFQKPQLEEVYWYQP